MNVLQALFCNQYDELVKTGRDGNKARKNGLILCSVCITLNLFTVLAIFFRAAPFFTNYIENASEYLDGKAIGKFLFAVVFGLLLVILRYTMATEKYFNNVVSKFNELGEADKKVVNRKAMIYCFGSVIIFIIVALSS